MRSLGAWAVGLSALAGCGAAHHGAEPERGIELPASAARPERAHAPRAAEGPGSPSPIPDAPEPEPTTTGAIDDAETGSGTEAAPAEPSPAEPSPAEPSPAEPSPAEPGPDGKTFTVDARLVDRGKRAPHCGIVHAVVVMKLEVLEVIDGRYEGDTLYVYVSCPEMWLMREPRRFELGRTYRWTLDTRIGRRTAGAKFDAFRGVKAPRYRLEKLVPLPVAAPVRDHEEHR